MIIVYTKPGCGYCVKAKNWLSLHDFQYTEIDVIQDYDSYHFLIDAGHKSLPQIYTKNADDAPNLLVEGGFDGLSNITPEDLRAKMAIS